MGMTNPRAKNEKDHEVGQELADSAAGVNTNIKGRTPILTLIDPVFASGASRTVVPVTPTTSDQGVQTLVAVMDYIATDEDHKAD